MSEVILFNHIPKTAGSTVRYILWRQVGRDRVLTSTTPGYRERINEIAAQLDRPLDKDYAVQTHIGCGVEEHLPARHDYRPFTFLRDPVQRTVSRYFFGRRSKHLGDRAGLTLSEFLEENTAESFNVQTAFLSGLTAMHHLEGIPLGPDQFDDGTLARAKRNLEAHTVAGLTERFDESLMLLRENFGWPLLKTLYRPGNVGVSRRAGVEPGRREIEAVRASNELDIELYEFALEHFEQQLQELPGHRRRLRRFGGLNAAYGSIQPVARRVKSAALGD